MNSVFCRSVLFAILSGCFLGIPFRVDAQIPIEGIDYQEPKKTLPHKPYKSPGSVSGSTVTLVLRNVTIEEALNKLASNASVGLLYAKGDLPAGKKVSLSARDLELKAALDHVLRETGLVADIKSDRQVLIRKIVQDSTKQGKEIGGIITGKVVDSSTGKAIGGATVSIRERNLAVVTNNQGQFALKNVPTGTHTVAVKIFGYSQDDQRVKVVAGETGSVSFRLKPLATTLNEVVTTAAGTQRRIEVGNDITSVNVDSIMKVMPVGSLSDLLATRVPGMVVTKTSGAPGAPSKIRIRGLSSMNSTNDPIVYVDGVRVYSAQGNTGTGSMNTIEEYQAGGQVDRSTNMVAKSQQNGKAFLVSSPIDQIDPNTIETVEVLKGPSAVALYGTDAANGVIVITTKRGQPGAPKWSVNADFGTETMPGKWPNSYWRWGYDLQGDGTRDVRDQCTLQNEQQQRCIPDNLVKFQILNDKHTTIFGRGHKQRYQGEVRGGLRGLTYALTGSVGKHYGLLKLPDIDVELLNASGADVPGWQRRPQGKDEQGGSIRVDADLGSVTRLAYTNMMSRVFTRTTPFEAAIAKAATFPPSGTPFTVASLPGDTAIGTGLLQAEGVPDYAKRISSRTLMMTNSLDLTAMPRDWITANATAGLDIRNRLDLATMERGACIGCITGMTRDSGEYNNGQGSSMLTSLNARLSALPNFNRTFSIRTTIGGNYTRTTTNDLSRNAYDLPLGATSGNGAVTVTTSARIDDRITVGVYMETTVGIGNVFYLPIAIRKDAGSALGGGVAPKFPKLAYSYVLSELAGFERIPVLGRLNTLRIRTAYGESGVQPSVQAKLRTYSIRQQIVEGQSVTTASIGSIGNSLVRPERTKEFEGGFDLGMLDERLNFTFTVYRKQTNDALVSKNLPMSLGIGSLSETQLNIGKVNNSGLDMSFDARIIDKQTVSWTVNANYSDNRNKLVRLGSEAKDVWDLFGGSASKQRFVEGYPLFGRWARPIIGFEDVDGNGYISANEVILGDSSVFLGAPYPRYTSSAHSMLTISRFTVGVVLRYTNGANQINTLSTQRISRAFNDPTTPLAVQAYTSVLGTTSIGSAQSVSTMRFEALSVNYNVPESITRRYLWGRQLRVAIQGTNLGLITNYRGKDPNVSESMNEIERDVGTLPQPRAWNLSFRIN